MNDAIPADQEVLNKITKYCDYRERCSAEVQQKLREMGCNEVQVRAMLEHLFEDNIVNDERYALNYAGSKFRINSWGKRKIWSALHLKGISDHAIQKALGSITKEAYTEKLDRLISERIGKLNGKLTRQTKLKVLNYVKSKGYEYDLSIEALNRLYGR